MFLESRPEALVSKPLLTWHVQGLAVKATRGNALLFYSLLPGGDTDPTSLHGSCPTTKGDKYSATKWVRTARLTAGRWYMLCFRGIGYGRRT